MPRFTSQPTISRPRMTFTPWKARGAAVSSALLLAAAFPPLNWWPLALVAMVPLLLAVWSRSAGHSKTFHALFLPSTTAKEAIGGGGLDIPGREAQGLGGLAADAVRERHRPEAGAPVFWRGFRLGWLFGFVFFTATLWWIQHVTIAGMLALTAYLALYPALVMGLAGWLGLNPEAGWAANWGKAFLTATIWCGLEWVRSVALWGFPWNGLAVPLFSMVGLRVISSLTGVVGLAAIVVLVKCLFVARLLSSGRMGRHTGVSLFLLCLGWAGWEIFAGGALRVPELTASVGRGPLQAEFHAILLQPDITMEQKLSPDPEVQRQRYFDLVSQTDAALASAAGPEGKLKMDLVVWPESAVPGFFDDMVKGGAFIDQLEQGDFTLVTGADHREWDKLYNSIAIMRGTPENRAIHPKIRLVPFGEFIPFRKEVPLFEKMLGHLIPMDFNAGTSLEPMKVGGQPFSIVPLVCFEDTIGDHARKFIREEPQVIVNVTNDNWFHESPATEMHFANARWRALELRRTLIRSANTGVTAIVSPWGSVQRLPSHQPGVVAGTFYTGLGEMTFYARHGDLFSQCSGVLALIGCLGVAWIRQKTNGQIPTVVTS